MGAGDSGRVSQGPSFPGGAIHAYQERSSNYVCRLLGNG
jgi:hypothetical protein